MRHQWWCLDCRAPVGLSSSGRCEACDSDAVDVMAPGDQSLEMLAVPSPACVENKEQPLFLRLGAFLRFDKINSASSLSSLLRFTSPGLQHEGHEHDSARLN